MSKTRRKRVGRQEYAEAHGMNPEYVKQLAREGRIKGARKNAAGNWTMHIDAERLPPKERHRRKWRQKWEKYDQTAQQRERRARKREERQNGGA